MKAHIIRCVLLVSSAVHNADAQTQPGSLLWSYYADGAIRSVPTLATNGTVYVGTLFSLSAVTNSAAYGSNKWVFAAGVAGSPAVGLDGTIYFGDLSVDCNIRAITPDGSQKWAIPLQPEYVEQIQFQSTPAIGWDGTIYFMAGGRLYAVAPNGTKKWKYLVDDPSGSFPLSPVIGLDGTIYVGSLSGRKLFAFTPDGTNKWSAPLPPNGSGESPAIGSDGTIFVTSGVLQAFNTEGSNIWSGVSAAYQCQSVVIGNDGTLYAVAGDTKSLSAILPGGEVKWSALNMYNQYHLLPTAPAVDSAGTAYYCMSNSLWAINAQGQVRWLLGIPPNGPPLADSAFSSPMIGPDGTIYAAIGSTLFAVCGTNGTGNAAWPMYHQNPRRTGKIEKPALKQPQKRSDGNFQFELHAQVGQTQILQSSTDLANWGLLTSVVPAEVPTDVVDLAASNFQSRYYRAVVP
jgi:outer membrane protein assembly factor BamB